MGLTRGELRKVGLTRGGSHMRWVLREVDYVRYESPSEMFHSLIFCILHKCTSAISY